VVAPFSEDLTGLEGLARLSGQVSGTWVDPKMVATVDLSDATVPVPNLNRFLRGVNGRIRLTPQALFVEQLGGQLDTGRFSLTGEVNLDHFKPVSTNLRLSATALPLQVPDTVDVLLDADLFLKGPWAASTLGGTVVLLEGTYFQDMNLSLLTGLTKIAQKKRTVRPPPKKISNPFLANLTFLIDVRYRQPFRVDNDLADLEVNPDLKISGKFNHLILTGRADVVSGQVRFEQRKFTIQKGVIAFLNPYRTEPSFDISGKTKIRTWDITLAVTGTADAFRVQLTSEPPLVQDDIVSLLVLGKTSGELIEGEGGQSKSSTQLLADLAASAFGDDIRKATGLDLLEVETEGVDENQNPEEPVDNNSTDRVKVTIGKNLSRRLAIKYAMESKDGELTQRADAEYQLWEHLLVSGFQGSDGIYGGQFLFRLEFR
jgi:autotransporter translocation and assembly factor TamB